MKVYYIGDCGHFVFLPHECETCKSNKDVINSGMVTVEAIYLYELESDVKRLRKEVKTLANSLSVALSNKAEIIKESERLREALEEMANPPKRYESLDWVTERARAALEGGE